VVDRQFGTGRQVAMFGQQTADVLEACEHGGVVRVATLVDDGCAFVGVHA
jgi:hypothetical protein